jgi:hypothetical protein
MAPPNASFATTVRNFATKAAWAAFLVTGLGFAGGASADEVFKVSTAISLPNSQHITSFDISIVDPVIGLYALADRTNKVVDLADTTTNTILTQLAATPAFAGVATSCGTGNNNDCSGPNGIIIVSNREMWAGDGNSTLKVIDLFSQKTTHIIGTGGNFRADELCVDPRDHVVLIANDAEHVSSTTWPFVSFVSTVNYSVLGRITMDGSGGTPKATNGIEQCQWSRRTGKFYVNIPEVNGPGDDSAAGAVVVISPTTMAIEQIFTLPHDKCAGPQGMAIGPDDQILIGCNASSSSVVINAKNGNVIATLANEGGTDEVWFNDGDDHYFLAQSAPSFSSNQLLGVVDAEKFRTDQSIVTGIKNTATTPHGAAHSVAADPVMNQVYVPIPSTAGSTLCSAGGGSDTVGCIAVLSTSHDDQRIAMNGRGRNK